jgi:hypothetical protein
MVNKGDKFTAGSDDIIYELGDIRPRKLLMVNSPLAIEISWTIYNEKNTVYYDISEVERSFEDKLWTKIN